MIVRKGREEYKEGQGAHQDRKGEDKKKNPPSILSEKVK